MVMMLMMLMVMMMMMMTIILFIQSGGDISISARGDEEDLAKWHTFLDITNVKMSNQVSRKQYLGIIMSMKIFGKTEIYTK